MADLVGNKASLLRPQSGNEDFAWGQTWQRKYGPKGRCGICGEYEGFHPRCWWAWLSEERVIRGGWDGEQQIEPDEPWPSRLWVAWRTVLTMLDPRWYWFCWKERIPPWPLD